MVISRSDAAVVDSRMRERTAAIRFAAGAAGRPFEAFGFFRFDMVNST
jgi:hypothetical protein